MSVTPEFAGQYYRDTDTGNLWVANSTTPGDWSLQLQNMEVEWTPRSIKFGEVVTFTTQGPSAGLTALTFKQATSLGGFDIEGQPNLTSVAFPNLVSVDPLGLTNFVIFQISNNPVLASVALPVCTTLSQAGNIGQITIGNNVSLTTISVPQFVPDDGLIMHFQRNALNAASVEQILRRCVLAGVTTCTIDLSGGTNAGTASLNAQGQADVATLGAQVTMNP